MSEESEKILLCLFREAEMTVVKRKSKMITEIEMHINGKTYTFIDTFSPERQWVMRKRDGSEMSEMDMMVLYAECDLRRKMNEFPAQD